MRMAEMQQTRGARRETGDDGIGHHRTCRKT
jgi:hypothetical protein